MATLSYASATEITLRLESDENTILTAVRGCSWWVKADIERNAPEDNRVTSVILTAHRDMEAVIRSILQMSFGLVFPVKGGVGEQRDNKKHANGRKRVGITPSSLPHSEEG